MASCESCASSPTTTALPFGSMPVEGLRQYVPNPRWVTESKFLVLDATKLGVAPGMTTAYALALPAGPVGPSGPCGPAGPGGSAGRCGPAGACVRVCACSRQRLPHVGLPHFIAAFLREASARNENLSVQPGSNGIPRAYEYFGRLQDLLGPAVRDVDPHAGMRRGPEIPALDVARANLGDRLDGGGAGSIRHPDRRLTRRRIAESDLRAAVAEEAQPRQGRLRRNQV